MADTDKVLALATAVRTFLLPHWWHWHEAWGPPAPVTPSQWTCVRSSLMLVRALERHGVGAALRSGRPSDGSSCIVGDDHGLLIGNSWASHAWVEAADLIVDITGDQFGRAAVVVTSVDDPAFRKASDDAFQLTPTRAGIAAVDEVWPSWCSFADEGLY